MLGRRVINSSSQYQTTSGIDYTTETIGDRIRKLRKERNWSQVQLGLKIHVTETTISKYKNDKLKIDIRTANELANAFHITVEALLYSNKPPQKVKFQGEREKLREIIKEKLDKVNTVKDLQEINQKIDQMLAKTKRK